MPLFVCDECHTLDNTALGEYWTRLEGQRYCSAHSKKRDYKWHNIFPRQRVISGQTGKLVSLDGVVLEDYV